MHHSNVIPPSKAQGFEKKTLLPEVETDEVFTPTSVVVNLCDKQDILGEVAYGAFADMVLAHQLTPKQCDELYSQRKKIAEIIQFALTPLIKEVTRTTTP